MDFPVTLDSQSELPIHRQLYEEIRQSILSGRLKPGQRLPSTRGLAEALGISRMTTSMAYECLLSEGYLQASVGSGTFVSRQLPDELLKAKAQLGNESRRGSAAYTAGKKSGQKRLSRYGTQLRDQEWLAYGDEEPEIEFSFGRPAMEEFPKRQWMQLMNEHWRNSDLSTLDNPCRSQGYRPLREAIAGYLSRARAVNCEADRIIIVNGSQQSIDLVTRVLLDRGDAVGLEEPGYIGAKKAFEANGANIFPMQVDAGGLIVEHLKAPNVPPLRLVYVTPSHQFPTGVVLSLPRRLELLSWAQRTGACIVEDDYDSEYRYKGRPIPALAGLDKHESVIYIGTFSKVLFPSLRLGYMVVPAGLVETFARAKWLADMHSPLLDQQVLADFIRLGHFDRHLRRMRSLYEQRRKQVIAALNQEFGELVSLVGDNAGINVLIRFQVPVDDKLLIQEARKLKVGLPSTRQFYSGERPSGEFLLNYGGLDDTTIKEGIARLAVAFAASRVG